MNRFARSEITSRLVAYLSAFDKGTELTYGDLTKGGGNEVGPRSHHLRSARRILVEERSQVWLPIAPGVGVRRLTDGEIAERLPRWFLAGARRKLARGQNHSGTVDLRALDIGQQSRFAVASIQAELAAQALSKATRARVEKVARGTSNDLPAFNAVEWAITLMPMRRKEERT